MEHLHEVVSSTELFVASVAFFCAKMSEAAETDLVLSFSFCEIAKKPSNVCNRCVMIYPLEQIGYALLIFTANH